MQYRHQQKHHHRHITSLYDHHNHQHVGMDDHKQLLMHHDVMISSSSRSWPAPPTFPMLHSTQPAASFCSSDNSYVFFPLKLVFVIPINIFFASKHAKQRTPRRQGHAAWNQDWCIYYGRSSVRPKNYAKRGRVQIY